MVDYLINEDKESDLWMMLGESQIGLQKIQKSFILVCDTIKNLTANDKDLISYFNIEKTASKAEMESCIEQIKYLKNKLNKLKEEKR